MGTPCLDAIAEGSGSEVFQFIGEGQIASLASNTCVSLENNDPQLGGKLIMGKCNAESSFEMAASGQMKLRSMGNYCLVASSMGVSVEDCSESNVGGKFSQVAVTEFEPNAAASLKNGANLLKAAAKRRFHSATLGTFGPRMQPPMPLPGFMLWRALI